MVGATGRTQLTRPGLQRRSTYSQRKSTGILLILGFLVVNTLLQEAQELLDRAEFYVSAGVDFLNTSLERTANRAGFWS
jgi:hypothetical protein